MTSAKKRQAVYLENQKVSLKLKDLECDWSFADAYEKAIKECQDAAYLYLKFRPRAEGELRKALLEKGFLESEIQVVIENLIKQKMIDDERFVKYFLESYQKSKPLGLYAIKNKLKEKGISEMLIEEALLQYYKENSATEEAYLLIEKRWYKYEKLQNFEKKEKIFAYLYARGFETDIIGEVIEKLKEKGLF